jgi:hypothetical protein
MKKKLLSFCLLFLTYFSFASGAYDGDPDGERNLHPKLMETKTFSQLGLTTVEKRAAYLALLPSDLTFFETYISGNILSLSPNAFVFQMFEWCEKDSIATMKAMGQYGDSPLLQSALEADKKLYAFSQKKKLLDVWSQKDQPEWIDIVANQRAYNKREQEQTRSNLSL